MKIEKREYNNESVVVLIPESLEDQKMLDELNISSVSYENGRLIYKVRDEKDSGKDGIYPHCYLL